MWLLFLVSWLDNDMSLTFQSTNHLKTIWGRNMSPHVIKTFHWYFLVRSIRCQHQNLQDECQCLGRKYRDNTSGVLIKNTLSPMLWVVGRTTLCGKSWLSNIHFKKQFKKCIHLRLSSFTFIYIRMIPTKNYA